MRWIIKYSLSALPSVLILLYGQISLAQELQVDDFQNVRGELLNLLACLGLVKSKKDHLKKDEASPDPSS